MIVLGVILLILGSAALSSRSLGDRSRARGRGRGAVDRGFRGPRARRSQALLLSDETYCRRRHVSDRSSEMAHDASDDRTRRSRRVAIIGAGPGGICTAVSLLARGHDDFVILEQAPGDRRHLVPQPLPGRRVRHPVAPLLVLVRAQPRLVAAVRHASPRSRPTWRTSSTASALRPHIRLSTPVRSLRVGRRPRGVARHRR